MLTRIKIERTKPRRGIAETPWQTSGRHYVCAAPNLGPEKHHTRSATLVSTLAEVARLIGLEYSVRMAGPGLRPSMIGPRSLRVVP